MLADSSTFWFQLKFAIKMNAKLVNWIVNLLEIY